jgi:protein transport protein SEC31
MVKKLFEINETATFAWDPTQAILATGTLSGTLDDSFSNTSILRLYDHKSTVLGQVDNSSRSFIKRFNKLAWSRNGVIAGGLEDGSLSLWQAQAIIDKRYFLVHTFGSIHLTYAFFFLVKMLYY